MIEVQILEGITPLITESIISIIVQEVNDNPVLLLLEEGTDVIPASFLVDLVIEQNIANASTSNDITILLVAYDIDPGDDFDISVAPGAYGDLELTTQVKDVTLESQDCTEGWSVRRGLWKDLVDDLIGGVTPVHLPVPCDLNTNAPSSSVNWAIIHGRYTPEDGRRKGKSHW